MDLKEEIQKIVELQNIDSQMHYFQQKKNIELPAKLTQLKIQFEEKKKSLITFEEEFKQLNLKKKERELDLAAKEENIKKAQGHLYQLKTNKEYHAKLTEIASLKADVSLLEEGVIDILDKLKESEKKLLDKRNDISQEEKKFKQEENSASNNINEIELKIKDLDIKRVTINRDIEKIILSKYEKLLQLRSSLAIVPVNENSCGACHMHVTHQTLNEIKMYKELVFCASCLRILYIPDDVNEQKYTADIDAAK